MLKDINAHVSLHKQIAMYTRYHLVMCTPRVEMQNGGGF